ncbi:PREDICTED: uncharacterized protein LOC104702508 isoform X3 [Camelina sativa]|uniref:Uncharacterized protein LOC104702508 isoform X3 n=1 Tax=Camelina sativa TaxID=90675 RepID=A0ABM0SVB9_CAMSA|nr:PREDICTED: uncharacterized protein LOC104702508 isoform X3 [Camelina sativa]
MGQPKVSTDDGSNPGEPCEISSEVLTAGDRRLLKVELLLEETNYVSWKKLMYEASNENGLFPSSTNPSLNPNPNFENLLAQAPTENEMAGQPQAYRFNDVIQKIERLYMGRDSSDGEELGGAPDDDDYDTEDSFIDDAELDDYFEVDNSPIKHDGFFISRGKLERIEPTTSNQTPKKRRRKKSAKPCGDVVDVSRKQAKMAKTAGGKDQSAAPEPSLKNISNDSKTVPDSIPHTDEANHQPRNATSPKSKAAESSAPRHPICSSKNAHQESNSLPGKSRPNVSAKSTVVCQQENSGMHDLNIPTKKSGSNVRPKASTLEKAIRELEKVVAESSPPAATENQDADISSQAVKRRLPRDVKLKLAKVARIAQGSQGDVSGELINRLMSIVGHLIQIRSLKRNLKLMIESGDNANREKDTRFQQIKNEVIEMLKTRIPLMESQANNQEAGTSDDFLDVGSVGKPPLKKFVMDATLEGKLCDLYDNFVEGLDEDSSSQIRKLYANLAELWPNSLMDNREIKRAICREKERRRALKGNLGKEMDQTETTNGKHTQPVPSTEGTVYPAKASGVGVKASVDLSETIKSLVHSQPDMSKQQDDKLKGASNNPAAKGKTVRRKKKPDRKEPHLPAEKHLVLGLKQQTHPQTKAQAPPDLNRPS